MMQNRDFSACEKCIAAGNGVLRRLIMRVKWWSLSFLKILVTFYNVVNKISQCY
uniref:Uncharacterized protein n=1 Tax=Anguilla anguilla TaxID=7936 RepID=A0A0E9TI34_ANGAN